MARRRVRERRLRSRDGCDCRCEVAAEGGATGASRYGRIVSLGNKLGHTAHTITTARREGDELVLTTQDEVLEGRLRVAAVNGARLSTRTRLVFAASYIGASVLDEQFRFIGRVRAADQDYLELDAPVSPELVGRDLWVSSAGPDDELTLPAMVGWQR